MPTRPNRPSLAKSVDIAAYAMAKAEYVRELEEYADKLEKQANTLLAISSAKSKTIARQAAANNDHYPIYVLFPGYVRSRNDSQLHYVSAAELARLYGVNFDKCLVVYDVTLGYIKKDNYVELRPDHSGKYELPGVCK